MNIKYKIDNNDCWNCISHKPNNFGYPTIKINGVNYKIYKVFYEKYKHSIPNNLVIRHTCDNKLCINPNHLILGTHNDNVQDRVQRNRSAVGIRNGRSKLNERQVLEIFENTSSCYKLGKIYNVDPKTIRNIKNKKIWKNLLN